MASVLACYTDFLLSLQDASVTLHGEEFTVNVSLVSMAVVVCELL